MQTVRRSWFGHSLLLLSVLTTLQVASPAHADYTITLDTKENRGTWEGWGCSICWWGNGVGNSSYQDLYADLFFTLKTVPFMDKKLPGLGMNIVRYNVGGGGKPDDISGTPEKVPSDVSWYRDIDGYWLNWFSKDITSNSWDWSRDANQRAVLTAARNRGVNYIELFANAPMWWMTSEKSSAGGSLQSWNRRDFMFYLATVAKYAQDRWGITVNSIEPFNEPSAGWWTFPKSQEGCNIGTDQQAEMLGYLREELTSRGLTNVTITASDENSMNQGVATHNRFKGMSVKVNGTNQNVASLVDKVNIHSYSGLEPWRDNNTRKQLRQVVGTKKLWASEYGDNDGSGMALAQTIMEDINHLRPTAWIYWQPVEPYSAWGLVNGDYAKSGTAPNRAKPVWVYTKYYAMAQFTRFLRPGMRIIGNNDNNTCVAYDDKKRELTFITINYGNAQRIDYDLSTLRRSGSAARGVFTNTNGSANMEPLSVPVRNRRFSLNAPANSIYSLTVSDVRL